MGGLAVGAQDKLGVITMPYEGSRQWETVEVVGAQAQRQWGDVVDRLAR
jgi:hypothetical protein